MAAGRLVSGHRRLWRFEAGLGEEAQCPLERARVRLGSSGLVQLDVGEPAVVVDAMEVVVAGAATEDRTVAVPAVTPP